MRRQIIGLFCKRALQKRRNKVLHTYDVKLHYEVLRERHRIGALYRIADKWDVCITSYVCIADKWEAQDCRLHRSPSYVCITSYVYIADKWEASERYRTADCIVVFSEWDETLCLSLQRRETDVFLILCRYKAPIQCLSHSVPLVTTTISDIEIILMQKISSIEMIFCL